MDATLLELPFNINVNVEEIIIEKEEQSQIKREIELMLSTLTPRQREIIYLRYVQEYDYDQIAELMQISVHGCRKLVSKAIITLREKFGILISLLILI
jgi:RNA polymerase sigma factor (sigma-70 family)